MNYSEDKLGEMHFSSMKAQFFWTNQRKHNVQVMYLVRAPHLLYVMHTYTHKDKSGKGEIAKKRCAG